MSRIPTLWKQKTVDSMAKCLGGDGDLAVMQARADLQHICNHRATFHEILKAVHEYTKLDKPLAYILRSIPFLNVNLTICPPVLIPRPETEYWVEWFIDNHDCDGMRVLDVGTGSGCIALAVARAFPKAMVTGIDISHTAIRLARQNAHQNGLTNASFKVADLRYYKPPLKYDMILSNPPYIPRSRRLPKSVKCFEDRAALFSGHDGMQMIELLVGRCGDLLTTGEPPQTAQLVFEFDAPNHEKVSHLLSTKANSKYDINSDQFDRPRFAVVTNINSPAAT